MEWIGILASTITLLSFVLSTEVQMRLVNLIGSLVFIAYGVSINAPTVCAFNTLMVVVNAYKVYRIRADMHKEVRF